VRGDVRLFAFMDEPLSIADYNPLEDESGRSIRIRVVRPAKDHLVVQVEGVADRQAAERLANRSLYVPRDRLPPAEEDSFYHVDLIGLRAETSAGVLLGTVVGVQNFGAGDLLEVAPPAPRPTIYVPFRKHIVHQVDIAGGRVVIDPPAGLFEADEADAGDVAAETDTGGLPPLDRS
jgi:16S rRNA processing protein RimM